tara:strand:- start:391 stop:576 length:186 start_codon:yes stop_codon:yes gene_type:complete
MTDNRLPTCSEAELQSKLWDMYVIYSNHGPDSPPLSYEDWYKDYYLVDVWVCGSLAAGVVT